MPATKLNRTQHAGFSLVEIMVGLAIGMISVLIVMQVFATFEGQKRTTTGGADAQTNGGIGLFTVERDLRMAGYGLGFAIGCPMKRSFEGTALADLTLAPVTITDGLGGLPDSITVISSNKSSWSVPARVIADHAQAATVFNIDAPVGMAQNDLVVAYETIAGTPTCTLFQVSNVVPPSSIFHNIGSWNGNTAIFPATYTADQAQLMNLGSMLMHTYALDADSNLLLSDYSSATNTSSSQAISSDVVSLQAEYGFDTRNGVQTDAQVDTWSPTMITATADGTALTTAQALQRLYAVRFALVARSGLKEKAQANGVCNITTTSPSWSGGSIDISKNPDGTTNADWRCYRYKTFETVVPLRNLIWR